MTNASANCRNVGVKIKFFRNARALYLQDSETLHCQCRSLYATPCSAGLDLRVCFNEPEREIAHLAPGERLKVPTGLAMEPDNDAMAGEIAGEIAGFVYSRSGLGGKDGVCVAQGVGVVDPDYRGEIFIYLLNTSDQIREVRQGERVAQLIFQPFLRPQLHEAEELTESHRSTGGFGHSGKF